MKIIKTLTLIVLSLIPTLCATKATAQNTVSPYSMYGYGLLNDYAIGAQRQMGGVGIAQQTGRQINMMNPASYAAIDSLTFIWAIGADVSMLHSKENGKTGSATGGGLDYINMQFPIGKWMGASLGLVPYSSVGYSFGNEIKHGVVSNQGTGGITEAYAGISGKWRGISLGVNVTYGFGNIINDVYANTETGRNTLFEHVMRVRDWNVNIGAQYRQPIGRYDKVVVGLTYSPKKSMHGNSWAAYWDIDQDKAADTVGYMKLKNNYFRPTSIGSGVSYTHSRFYELTVEADFIWQNWAKAKYSSMYDEAGQLLYEGMKFADRMRGAIGAEFVPKLRGNYFERIAYRAGAYYSRDYITVLGNNVREYGISAGFGLPTPEGKTIINLGFEWKRREAYPAKLISENYFNITLGVNFNEMWFWQRKLK